MNIEDIISVGHESGASDIHIEAGLPFRLRVNGRLVQSEHKLTANTLISLVRALLGKDKWDAFLEGGSFDLSKVIRKVRCRINVFKTSRGPGLAIRLLVSRPVNTDNLNLHPDLRRITQLKHGLVLFSGPTGSGKSTSMAALTEEINVHQSQHIITLEQPVEYFFSPKKSLIRQREVGRDTPSFEKGLRDALREDPDVIIVGEMRDQESMKLTINAAETGHLVFATLHSSSAHEAIARMIGSFAANDQDNVRWQLADCLAAVVCQRMTFRNHPGIRVPECEILYANDSVRTNIRNGNISKLQDSIATGASDHMWSWERYRKWMDNKSDWVQLQNSVHDDEPEEPAYELSSMSGLSRPPHARAPAKSTDQHRSQSTGRRTYNEEDMNHEIVIDDSDEDLSSILDELK